MIRLFFYTCMVLLLFLGSCTSKTADKDKSAINDSIQKYLKLAGNDTLDSKLRNKYNDKAFSMIDLKKNDTLTRWYLYKNNINLSNLGNFDLPERTKILIEKSSEAKDTLGISRGYDCLGVFYAGQSKNELAIQYFFKAKKGYATQRAFKDEIRVIRNIALIQSFANDFLGSIKTSYQIINLSKKYNFNNYINSCYINIGNNLANLKNDKKAIEYYKKINLNEESRDYFVVNINIASCSIDLGNYNEAFHYLKKVVNSKNFKINNHKNSAVTYSLIGLYYLKINNKKQSYKFLKKAEKLFKSVKTFNGENYNQVYLSNYYSIVKDTLNSIKYAQRAVDLSKSYKNPTDELYSLAQLIKVDKKKSSLLAQEYIRINDSLQIAERRFRDKFAQVAYETDEIRQQRETAIKQKWIFCIIGGVIIIIIILLLVITRQRSKQNELQLLQSQQKANEEIYNLMLEQKSKEEEARQSEKRRIAIELHDGVMNRLASTRLNLDVLNYEKDSQTIEKCLPHISEIYKIEQEIRNIAHDLSIDQFKSKNSFVALINDFLSSLNEVSATNYQLEIDASIKWENVSSTIKMNFYRIIQEASHNINKFAEAKLTVISFIVDGVNICLSITDDGKGFDTEITTEGIGLKNIKRRVEAMKGKVVIQSIRNKNTSLNIAIPLNVI